MQKMNSCHSERKKEKMNRGWYFRVVRGTTYPDGSCVVKHWVWHYTTQKIEDPRLLFPE